MRILINTSAAVLGGAVTHLRHLLPGIARQAEGDQIIVVANRHTLEKLGELSNGLQVVSVCVDFSNPLRRTWWENVALPGIAAEAGADVILHPANMPLLRCRVPQVCVIHNVAPFMEEIVREESPYQRLRLRMLRHLTEVALTRSQASIFLSRWTRERVLSARPIDRQRWPVVYFGADQQRAETNASILRELDLQPQKYVLAVAHLYRYKRIEHLISAFKSRDVQATGASLVLAGAPVDLGYTNRLKSLAAETGARVIFAGALDSSSVSTLMASCAAFVFTSIAENLPITLLEAMSEGAPIVTNRCCSMPEICGDAAAYVSQPSPENYGREILKLLNDPGERRDRAAKSLARAKRFRWDEAARRTLTVLRRAVPGPPPGAATRPVL